MLEADRVARKVAAADGAAIALPEHTATGHAVHRLYWQGRIVDTLRSASGAAHAAYLLNTGAAHVAPHAATGTRVQPRPAAPRTAALQAPHTRPHAIA